ncbi:protein kinase [Streptomyces sp. NBC_00249]|uniref:protein kinase domain-containing protein n=1 Tax=Streptomyces sp. NBC_00249 TaxID=2975690 RepID=UPI00224D7E77|nr:protein kinase [Streptomyces sp. NBC_00249]MCX5195451.1 protein kinase [Streptomyces sp. NBC_00249]
MSAVDGAEGAAPLQPLGPADPERVGGFTLLGRLGSGGMGTVYLARSAGGRVVAVKTVHERLAREPEFRVRFRLEAEAARTIGARHGASVVDADTQGALPWLATEYVLGPSLAETVERYGPLPEPAVRALGARLARALADLHASGIVHRDLKPSNILITATGPKIIDFGIARALGARRLTRTGQAVGTPAYMSPEQATGQEHDPPGDLFALGGVLVFAVTGHGPFKGAQGADVLNRVRYEDPDLTGVPPSLLPDLTACLAKAPPTRPWPTDLADRLEDGPGDFATLLPGPLLADLGRRAAGVWDLRPARLPGPAREPDGPPPAAPLSRRRLLLAGTGTLAVLGTGGALWARYGAGPAGTPRAAKPSRPPGLAPDPLWTFPAGAETTVQGVSNGVVVVSVGNEAKRRSLVGLDARTGKPVWHQPRYVAFVDSGAGQLLRESQLSWDGDHDGPLFRLDPATGALTPLFGAFGAVLPLSDCGVTAVADGTLYLNGFVRQGPRLSRVPALAAYDMAGGKQLWLRRTGDRYPSGPGAATGDLLLYKTTQEIVGVARSDGQERWRVKLTTDVLSDNVPLTARAMADGRVHICGTEVSAVDTATGKLLWQALADRPAPRGVSKRYGHPVVQDGTVHLMALDAPDPRDPNPLAYTSLIALRASDGAVQWEYQTRVPLRYDTLPHIHGGTFYLDTGQVAQPLLPIGLTAHRPPWTYRRDTQDDGRSSPTGNGSRTALRLADGRLHLSCGPEVITLPLG